MSDRNDCRNCGHGVRHNLWGKCAEPGCECRAYEPGDATVVVIRNPETFRPVAVPDEIVTHADMVWAAYRDHRAGKSWREIAYAHPDRWPTAAAVATEVKSYLDEGRAVFRGFTGAELLAVEFDALGALKTAFWEKAIAGNVQAAQVVRQVIRDRIELAALMTPPDDGAEGTGPGGSPRTLVIGTDGAYAEDLRAAQQ